MKQVFLDTLDFILRAKKQGFVIRLFFVGTSSPTINASRNLCFPGLLNEHRER